MPTINDVLTLVPEFYLVAVTCVLLLVDAFAPARRNLVHWLAIVFVLFAIVLVVKGQPERAVTAFNGSFVRDGVSEILKVFALLTTALVFVFGKPYLQERKLWVGEFYSLTLFAVLGVMLLVSAGNLVTVYLGLELLTLSSYALVALNRDSPLSSEAAMKYFVLGALASGMLLYGMSMIYGATGSLDLAVIHAAAPHVAMHHLLLFGMIFMITGIAFKLGAAPFHMWIPDVYEGSPTAVTLFIGSTPKLAAFGMAYRLLDGGLGDLAHVWQPIIAVLAVLSLAIGNVVALVQTNLKRMLAYSTISHMGFLLVGLVNAGPEGYAAALFYAISYALMGTAGFGVILALARAGFECDRIEDLRGLNQRSPWLAFLLLLVMFSLAGIPPLFGFFAKLMVLEAAIHAGMVWLAVVALGFALIGLYYYLRVVKVMYFDRVEASDHFPAPQSNLPLRLVLSLNVLVLVALGFCWGPLLSWCQQVFVA